MWEAVKNVLVGIKEATGIEIPGLPTDLSSIGESATTAVQSVTESATGVIDKVTAVTDTLGGSVADVADTAAATIDSATRILPQG